MKLLKIFLKIILNEENILDSRPTFVGEGAQDKGPQPVPGFSSHECMCNILVTIPASLSFLPSIRWWGWERGLHRPWQQTSGCLVNSGDPGS